MISGKSLNFGGLKTILMDKVDEKLNLVDKVVILFTSNFQGGILQFTMQLGLILSKLGYQVVVFIPDNACIRENSNELITIKSYKKYKRIRSRNKFSKKIANEIEKLNPSLVLFSDASLISSQVLLSLKTSIRTSMFLHDVLPHPIKLNIYEYFRRVLNKRTFKKAVKFTNQIILLSNNSYNIFREMYPAYLEKATWMPLGPHVPEVEHKKPFELDETLKNKYYLFFGRISKYKGIINLLNAYSSIKKEEKIPLVIAGGGELQEEEKELIKNDNNIILINRFIEDGEMLYLINNSLTVVLPYIEASQSGVIPIAYYYGIPVITSNVPGLVEFVDKDSGIVCKNNEEMKNALLKICGVEYHKHLSSGAYQFYRERLNWSKNLKRCIETVLNDNQEIDQ